MKQAYTFCTTSTQSHLYKCYALAESIAPFKGELHILLVDSNNYSEPVPENVQLLFLDDLKLQLANQIKVKYHSYTDKLRWSLKPVLLLHLLASHKKAVYLDNDIFFFNDFTFIFDDLDNHPILLTPHHYPRDPKKEQNWFEANFRVGLYNAGFIGVNQLAVDTLNWWAEACLYRCEKNYWRGLFDDQKYLDLFPIINPQTKVLQHPGCNVAEWNKELCVVQERNTELIVNESFQLIFYHFNGFSLTHLNKKSKVFNTYFNTLSKHNKEITSAGLIPKSSMADNLKLAIWKILNWWNA